jgi:hypothetical protein
LNGATADVEGRGDPAVDGKVLGPYGGTDDVDDGVNGADLVEVDALDRDAVNGGFGFTEELERAAGVVLHCIGKRGSGDDAEDGGERAVFVLVSLLVSVFAGVFVITGVFVGMGVFVLVLVRVLAVVLMLMRACMVVGFSVGVAVRVAMLVGMGEAVVPVGMRVDVRMRGRRSRGDGGFAGVNTFVAASGFADADVDLGAGEAAAQDFAGLEARPDVEGIGGSGKLVKRDARVDHGAEEHVAADAGEAVEISNSHAL